MNKQPENKPVIVECRYVGIISFPSWRKWHKWKAYRNVETAQMAIDNLNRKDKVHEYRMRQND
jgi:hypothetical protein